MSYVALFITEFNLILCFEDGRFLVSIKLATHFASIRNYQVEMLINCFETMAFAGYHRREFCPD